MFFVQRYYVALDTNMKYNVYGRLFIIVLLRSALALYLNYHFEKHLQDMKEKILKLEGNIIYLSNQSSKKHSRINF